MIPVVDLFAGPGGLGEGFSAFNAPERPFKICISIEKDEAAHKTLLLRSFYRQFDSGGVPDAYYDFLRSPQFSVESLNKLLDRFDEGEAAREEACCLELGCDNNKISRRIKKAIGDRISENLPWVLIGGPPCQAYSLVGRARNKGIKNWSLDTDPRSKLYLEYLRVLGRFQPAIFIMENVKGILSAKLGDSRVIDLMINDLQQPNRVPSVGTRPLSGKNHSYRLFSLVRKPDENSLFDAAALDASDCVIECESFGIPQRRHRVIIMGIRDDYAHLQFDGLQPVKKQVPLRKAIGELPERYSGFSGKRDKLSALDQRLLRYDDWRELIRGFFAKFHFDDKLQNIIRNRLVDLGQRKRGCRTSVFDPDWFLCDRLHGHACNHEPRTHMRSDFLRYFFVSCFGKAFGRSPKLEDFPKKLLPAHENVNGDHFVDRFKVQLNDIPSTTITCHISKDGHYYIHPDPRQCRSLTVREAARLQTFPDDYFFCGYRTQQYHQVGNAVPPLLARQIAGIVYQIIEQTDGLL